MTVCFVCKSINEYGVVCSTYRFCSIECMNMQLKLNDLIKLFSEKFVIKPPKQSPEVFQSLVVPKP